MRLRVPLRRLGITACAITLVASSAYAAGMARCTGQSIDLFSVPGGHAPYIQLNADGQTGAFQLDYGSTQSSISAEALAAAVAGGSTTHDVRRFSLPTFERGRFQLARYGLLREPPGGQLGIVGTDFLAKLTADFVFGPRGGDVVLSAHACDEALLRRRGMVPVTQAGHFASDVRRVRQDLPNVPVLPLRIGGVQVWAQIDTGYDDIAFAPSIDINDALFVRLVGEGVELLPAGAVTVTTCRGAETREVYEARQTAVAIVGGDGAVLLPLRDARLVRKRQAGCGGIAGRPEPAAQLGVSVLQRMGAIVFDPGREQVWVPALAQD